MAKLVKSNEKSTGNDTRFPREKVGSEFMKLLQAMATINMKLNYELGEQLTRIIHTLEIRDSEPDFQDDSQPDVFEDIKTGWDIYDLMESDRCFTRREI